MDKVREITLKRHPAKDFPISVGDTAKVSIKVKEGSKERVQIFEGVILKIQGKDFSRSFTVRKMSDGVGVEKTIPLSSPNVTNVEVVSKAKVRRARLFYLRNLRGRAARLNTKKLKNFKSVLSKKSKTKAAQDISESKKTDSDPETNSKDQKN